MAIIQWLTNRKTHNGLSNSAIFNDLERSLTWFSRLRHSLTLTNEYLTNGYKYGQVTIEGEKEPHPSFRMAPVSMTLSDL